MTEIKDRGKQLDRREFLTGSALIAAAVSVVAATSASAQESQSKPAPSEEPKPAEEPKNDQEAPKKLVDKQGREFRVCDMCGGNMYKQDNTWTCEQCGYSYTE